MGLPPVTASASDTIRQELTTVLHSELFSRTPALANLLSYLCEKTIAGDTSQLKEYTIAVEVFGRKADYDQDSDSIVRVEAARLRKRLKQYYETIGPAHEIQITIPVGQYVPVFQEIRPSETRQETVATEVPAPPRETKKKRHALVGVIAAAVIALVAIVGLVLWLQRRQSQPEAAEQKSATRSYEAVSGLPAGDEIRIHCGSDRQYVDRSGKTWMADQFYAGGTAARSSIAHIWRTPDAELYRTSRQGDFSYDIPVKPGVYELHLHFAETFYGPEEQAGGGEGSRLLGVSANGQPLIESLDVVSDADGARTADEKVFVGLRPATDGVLHLKFWSTHGGRGMVSAIEVLPGRDGKIRPIRIATRESAYYSDDSRWWGPDKYFKGGQLAQHNESLVGAGDSELYASERWGNFSYSIPVGPGKYTVTMAFVERCGPQSAENCVGGAGPRAFNVLCNGRVLLKEFNPAQDSGVRHVVVKKFSGLEPNPQGKLLLEFVPLRGYATVTALEVLPD